MRRLTVDPGTLPAALRIYSVQQVAQILQLNEAGVRRLIVSGQLAASRVGVLWRITQPALESFLEGTAARVPGR
jgi:excisionase family DNA binding protein